MSTPRGRPRRHDPEPGKLRTLTSFLTCRIASRPAAPPGHRLRSSNGGCVAPAAHEQPSAYRPGIDAGASAAVAFRGGPGTSDPRDRCVLSSGPDDFPSGIDAEWYSFRDVATGIGVPPALLRHPRIADEAQRGLHALDGVLCSLDAFVILPTHVHMLFTQQVGLLGGPSPEQVAAVFKMMVGQRAHRQLGRIGDFWETDDFHRYLPTAAERRAALEFIRRAPVRGGLVEKPEEWEWLYVREGAAGGA